MQWQHMELWPSVYWSPFADRYYDNKKSHYWKNRAEICTDCLKSIKANIEHVSVCLVLVTLTWIIWVPLRPYAWCMPNVISFVIFTSLGASDIYTLLQMNYPGHMLLLRLDAFRLSPTIVYHTTKTNNWNRSKCLLKWRHVNLKDSMSWFV